MKYASPHFFHKAVPESLAQYGTVPAVLAAAPSWRDGRNDHLSRHRPGILLWKSDRERRGPQVHLYRAAPLHTLVSRLFVFAVWSLQVVWVARGSVFRHHPPRPFC